MSMWTIQTCEPSETGPLTFRLSAGAVKTVGRANLADIVLDAALVSRFHCRLSVTPTDTLEVEDLQSTNGTWVNDERVGRLQLAAGDRLRVGRVELKVERA
jgi:pSer/pThr/pTyr-binding forkhead associated (FHA) protein